MAVGNRRASKEMRIAEALRDRLPSVAALVRQRRAEHPAGLDNHLGHPAGRRPRTRWRSIDAAIAERAAHWEVLSEDKLRDAVDVQVARYDPDALRRTEIVTRGRDFTIGACDDDAETVSVWGRLLPPRGRVLKQRVTAMVNEALRRRSAQRR